MACNFCTLKVLIVFLVLFVAFFIVSLVLAFKVFPDLLYSEVNKGTRLEKGTDQYDRFVELPFDLDFKVYLWTVDNADAILEGQPPQLKEVGPFVYKEHRKKTIMSVNEKDDTITYTQAEKFIFDRNQSVTSEDDLITVLNPALWTMYQVAESFLGISLAGIVDMCVKKTIEENHADLFITVPVKDLLFGGFKFCINETIVNDTNFICSFANQILCEQAVGRRNVEQEDGYLRFSYLRFKLETDGVYTVKRGMDEIDTLGSIVEWNYSDHSSFWGNDTTCDVIKGTDSTIYPPRITKNDSLYIYATEICRYVEITYQGEDTYKDVQGYLFGTNEDTLFSKDPDSDCYCTHLTIDTDGKESCYLDGLLDVQNCFSAPILLSFPHFLWADKYLNAVTGDIKPNEELHKIFLLIEPNTGTPLKGAKRVQFNTVVRPIVGIKQLFNMTRTVLPLVWIDEGVALPDKYVKLIDTTYFDNVHLLEGVKWALVAISAVLVVVFVVLIFLKRKRQSSKQHM